jgi:hypothetical protein
MYACAGLYNKFLFYFFSDFYTFNEVSTNMKFKAQVQMGHVGGENENGSAEYEYTFSP